MYWIKTIILQFSHLDWAQPMALLVFTALHIDLWSIAGLTRGGWSKMISAGTTCFCCLLSLTPQQAHPGLFSCCQSRFPRQKLGTCLRIIQGLLRPMLRFGTLSHLLSSVSKGESQGQQSHVVRAYIQTRVKDYWGLFFFWSICHLYTLHV